MTMAIERTATVMMTRTAMMATDAAMRTAMAMAVERMATVMMTRTAMMAMRTAMKTAAETMVTTTEKWPRISHHPILSIIVLTIQRILSPGISLHFVSQIIYSNCVISCCHILNCVICSFLILYLAINND